MMSAQETTPGHFFSTAVLARMMVSKPSPARDMLSDASFSASSLGDAIRTEASQPCDVNEHQTPVPEGEASKVV
jgi:hypothetical protein